MTEQDAAAGLPAEDGAIGKPSQAEGDDNGATRDADVDSNPEADLDEPIGKPSQAEGEDPDDPQI
ncbi:MAG: hypothetical protein JWQ68_1584 [Cryobacterium sp.]|jgi:hypothetical protein|nr:hypothetical protein [Cryobacterium sp.]